VNERSRGALGYQFDSTGVDNWFAKSPFNSSLLPALGDVVTFDTLSVPYAFALTAAYDTGMIDSSSDINELHAPRPPPRLKKDPRYCTVNAERSFGRDRKFFLRSS